MITGQTLLPLRHWRICVFYCSHVVFLWLGCEVDRGRRWSTSSVTEAALELGSFFQFQRGGSQGSFVCVRVCVCSRACVYASVLTGSETENKEQKSSNVNCCFPLLARRPWEHSSHHPIQGKGYRHGDGIWQGWSKMSLCIITYMRTGVGLFSVIWAQVQT